MNYKISDILVSKNGNSVVEMEITEIFGSTAKSRKYKMVCKKSVNMTDSRFQLGASSYFSVIDIDNNKYWTVK